MCMAQKTITPNCVQCYIAAIGRLSRELLEKVINLQDYKVYINIMCIMHIISNCMFLDFVVP